jgi:DNA-binding IclR family transcriptional regulator
LRAALAGQTGVVTADELAKAFKGVRTATLANLLQTLVSLGLAREVSAGKFTA